MIKRLFIANRGEIARRIALTATRLGVQSVVLTDRAAPPAYLLGAATEFLRVPEESASLYLDGAKMVAYAKEAGCDAVHPGFGFLSENAGFAAAVQKAGLVWVGPNPSAIEAMASKAAARQRAEQAQVPVVRGLNGVSLEGDQLEKFAKDAGFPLLIKAALGGGGKGMRVVRQQGELREAAQRAASEAKNSFGDSALIVEQYLEAPRHVEVQILADKHGTVVAIGDRDCSVQRRHQKIIEEAPAPMLGPETRAALHAAAIRLAAAVGYDSTGTVEFLVDWSEASRKAKEQRFFFLEMNTRLQVEHPVTEEVFGLDLVEQQLRVASGEKLPEAFKTLQPRGHSVEIRLYAEDPGNDFFPAPGPVAAFRPAQGPGLRWETGLDDTDEVTGRFDPMVAKLVATGPDRPAALARLCDGLRRTFFAAPASNIDLLVELSERSAFAKAPVTTHYLTQNLTGFLAAIEEKRAKLAPIAEAIAAAQTVGPSQGGDELNVRIGAMFGASLAAPVEGLTPSLSQSLTPTTKIIHGLWPNSPTGKPIPFWYASQASGQERGSWVHVGGTCFVRRETRARTQQRGGASASATDIAAPVPGKVIAVKVEPGATIESGKPLFVLESMKMEFEVKAPRAGTVAAVNVKVGDQVTAGTKLASWAE